MKGYKKSNQDRCTAFSYLEVCRTQSFKKRQKLKFNWNSNDCNLTEVICKADPELAYFAVYDGHGGTGVANYLKDHLHEFILAQEEYREGDIPEAILKSFLAVDSELKSYGNATELTGSTGILLGVTSLTWILFWLTYLLCFPAATCVLIKHGDLIVANLGDGRAVASVHNLAKQITQVQGKSGEKGCSGLYVRTTIPGTRESGTGWRRWEESLRRTEWAGFSFRPGDACCAALSLCSFSFQYL